MPGIVFTEIASWENPVLKMAINAPDIVRYIVWYATENDVRLTTNRLVKFVYLADLYNARLKSGETLSGFPWRFVHYGPYCSEVLKCIDQAVCEGLIFKQSFDSRFGEEKAYHVFSCSDKRAEKIENDIHVGVLGRLQSDIRKMGDDTPQLLDYVYYETEPMMKVKKGERLDFSKAKKPEPVKQIKLKMLPPDVVKAAREKIKRLGAEMKAERARIVKDEKALEKYKDNAYYSFLKFLDGEALTAGLNGTAKIQMSE